VRRVIPMLLVAALGFLAFDAWSSATAYVVREQGSVETLSDRFPLWAHLTTTVMREAPVIGLGYYSASRVVGPEYNPALGDAHSVFFETLVGGGLIGAGAYLVLAGALTLYAVRLLMAVQGDPVMVAAIGLLITTLLLGTTSSQAIQPGPLGFSFWLLTALLPSTWEAHIARRRAAGARRSRTPP
jgi:O-antigen ligase